MTPLAIRIEHLSKQYHIGGSQSSYRTLRETLVSGIKNFRLSRLSRSTDNFIWALKDISLEIQQGEAVGIIGRNGAGKSTLLKILSHITNPTEGRVEMFGRVGSLLEVGTGFHPELTGRENIYLNGAILGMKRAEIERKFDEIVAFAETEKFLDTPVKHYSTGMYMRLAFAVAAHLEPEILVVDEVLAVGDAEFQKKCLGKMGDVVHEGRTVLFVSHNIAAIKSLCNSGIFLEQGMVRSIGNIENVVNSYLNSGNISQEPYATIMDDPETPIQLNVVSVRDREHNIASNISIDEPFYLEVDFTIRRELSRCYIAIHIHDNDLNTLIFIRDFEQNENLLLKRIPGKYRYRLHIPAPLLVPGTYRVSVHAVIVEEGKKSVLDYACPFEIIDSGSERVKKGYSWIGKMNPPLILEIHNRI
jgi:lipopolysaccharide transport system ATP-binding protein